MASENNVKGGSFSNRIVGVCLVYAALLFVGLGIWHSHTSTILDEVHTITEQNKVLIQELVKTVIPPLKSAS